MNRDERRDQTIFKGLINRHANSLIWEPGMQLPSLVGQTRHVYVRGYTKKVKVLGQNKAGEWICDVLDDQTENGQTETVPEHHFYHRTNGGINGGLLIGREGSEFTRKYPGWPVQVELLPSPKI